MVAAAAAEAEAEASRAATARREVGEGNGAANIGRASAPKPSLTPRPTLEPQTTQQEWRQFTDRCARYKTAALEPNSYTPLQIANELWLCCCQELQNDLQNVGITHSYVRKTHAPHCTSFL